MKSSEGRISKYKSKSCKLCSQYGHFKEKCEIWTKQNIGMIGTSCRLNDVSIRDDAANNDT